MKKLFIVDAVNFLFRSYYAIGPMTNGKGESTNALYGFIRSIYKLINDFSPDYFVAVFDGPDNKKSRVEIYSEYKSHRTRMPEDLFSQLEQAVAFCDLAGIPQLTIPNVEADDTIGSVAKWAEEQGIDVYICSSDKDLCQLVSDRISIINPHKNNLCIDRAKVKELFGVYPEQIVDYLAMMGDASDNIPGLEGFGPKTTADLLCTYGTLEEILDHPERISGKKQEVIRNGREVALMSKQLAMLQLDVPFPREDSFFHLKVPDLNKVKEFYHEMRFNSLLKELGNQEAPPEKLEVEKKEHRYHLVDDETSLIAFLDSAKNQKEICIDTETTHLHPMLAKIVGIGFGWVPNEAWYIPWNGKLGKERLFAELKPLLEDRSILWAGHNIKYDLHVLRNEGIELHRLGFDTLVASYLIRPHIQRHNLDELSLEKFGIVKIPIEDLIGKGKKQISMDQVPIDSITAYCCEDVDCTLRLKGIFEQELKTSELLSLFSEIEMPLIPILAGMERKGIYVDLHHLEKMSHELNRTLKELEKEIYSLANEEFNINSPKQLSVILFEKMGIPPPKKTATGYSTAIDVLESLQNEAPIIKKIIAYRSLEKLRSTYVDALPHEVNPVTGRVHCTFNQSVAATGRLSCQNPNLQNIPIRSEEGKKIREAFKPQQPGYSFLSADYSQIELRLLAHLSNDPVLIKAFCSGEDIHAYTASLVFDVPIEQVTAQMRHRAKTVNFGIIYGQSPFGLSKELEIDYREAAQFIETYFQRYRHIKDYLEFCKESVRNSGKAVTLTGRQRPIPDIHSKNPAIRAAAERLAINTPLQGTAADLIKLAMIQVDAHLKKTPNEGVMILQIHDELLFESPDLQVDSLAIKIKSIMEGIFTLKVPLIVDISIGKNWGAC